jgi:hypothetical protein
MRAIAPMTCALSVCGASLGQSPAFTDVTIEAGLDVTYACEEQGNILLQMGGGGVVADFDNDGRQDLFALAGGTGPDRLYINNGDGTFTDQAESWGVARDHFGIGACAGDYDKDGWVDLFVTSIGNDEAEQIGVHKLYRNTGLGTFENVAVGAGVNQSSPNEPDGFGSCFGDWDLDGDLDLVVCGWADSFEGTRLFRNEGDGTFTDVTAIASNLDEVNVFGFSARLVDMNGDRYPELLLVGDFETSRYYVNDLARDGQATFTDVTEQANVSKESNGMGQTVGDVDNDGLPDWYVTSIFGGPQGGNFLYRNLGGDAYEALEDAGVTDGGWGWGTSAIDVNQDGWLDLVETNGWPQGYPTEQSYLFVNDGDGLSYTEMAVESGLVHNGMGRGLAGIDYDNDGDLDVVIFTYCGALRLYRNDAAAGGVRVFLDTSAEDGLAPEGRGSVVRVAAGGLTQMRMIDGGSNYLSHGEMSAHFGLGGPKVIDELRVEWVNGRVTTLEGVSPVPTMTVAYCPADFSGDGAANILDFVSLQLAFAAGADAADVNADGVLNVLDFVAFQLDFVGGCE